MRLAGPALLLCLVLRVACALPTGLHPEDADLLVGRSFKCRDGQKTIPLKLVNDDYCDCVDGSDEPGTSACHNGNFYCRNLGHVAASIPSLMVNDGVCDCCDGSDEYATSQQCSNTCIEMGAHQREALKRELEEKTEALRKRSELVALAKAGRAASQQELLDVAAQLEDARARQTALQESVDELDKAAERTRKLQNLEQRLKDLEKARAERLANPAPHASSEEDTAAATPQPENPASESSGVSEGKEDVLDYYPEDDDEDNARHFARLKADALEARRSRLRNRNEPDPLDQEDEERWAD
eukprot:CAMPEP_0177688154 /NCGR_PEP_ID=MMETSP0447-20121125/34511_1 /TAXON_ID=0 /ORGANISM="Stygamoeba regulata, Strain BSH-02190019" /LENGTH=298 /DNA_ID=CAMNT_0019198445 /DNA_START=15 /DNA_END=908 /DNA_ORIENTATION=-